MAKGVCEMQNTAPARKKTPYAEGCGGCIVIGAFILLPLSLLLSLVCGAMANDPGFMTTITTGGALGAIWAVAIAGAALAFLWAAAIIWRKHWAEGPKKPFPPARSRPVQLGQTALAAVIIGAVTLLPAAWAASAVSSSAPQNDAVTAMIATLAPFCNMSHGESKAPIAGTAPYAGLNHTIAVIAISANGDTRGEQGDVSANAEKIESLPGSLSSVQLVACVGGQETSTIEVCNYSRGGTYWRYGHFRDVWIFVAQSGLLIGHQTFTGSEPGPCPESQTVGKGSTTGGDVGTDDSGIWDFIGSYLNRAVDTSYPMSTPTA
jgi:hypothetical protein